VAADLKIAVVVDVPHYLVDNVPIQRSAWNMNKIPTIHLILTSAVLCAVPMVLPAHQSNIEAMLTGCALIDDDRQRHSCYDQVLRPDKVTDRTELPATAESNVQPGSVTPSQAPAEVVEVKPVAVEEFGLKQKQPREVVNMTVTVSGIRKNLTDRFVYTTTDGQVWVQNDTRRVRYDEVPFVAEIRSAALGSYYLKPKSSGVSVKVRREK